MCGKRIRGATGREPHISQTYCAPTPSVIGGQYGTTPAVKSVAHGHHGTAVSQPLHVITSALAIYPSAPIDPSHVEKHYDAVVDRVLSEGSAEWMVGGRTLTLKRAFVEDGERRTTSSSAWSKKSCSSRLVNARRSDPASASWTCTAQFQSKQICAGCVPNSRSHSTSQP
jgi:hypothetical protein